MCMCSTQTINKDQQDIQIHDIWSPPGHDAVLNIQRRAGESGGSGVLGFTLSWTKIPRGVDQAQLPPFSDKALN